MGPIPRNKYRSSTLVGLRHSEMALQAAFTTGSIFDACDDLLQTGDAYSAEDKHIVIGLPQIIICILYMYSRKTNKAGRTGRHVV